MHMYYLDIRDHYAAEFRVLYILSNYLHYFFLTKSSNLLGRGSFVARLDEIRPDRAYHLNPNRLFKHAASDSWTYFHQ